MGEPEAKRAKTEPEYELTYWPGIPGRGEVVRLLFEETGTPYIDVAKSKKAVDAVCAYSDLKNVGDAKNPPKFAPPVLKHGELVINQLPNILLYLAPRLGLGPSSGDGVYHLNEIALTILDGFLNEVHETHHPVGTAAYYEDQKDEAKTRSKAFREERLPKYLKYVQRVLDGERSGEGGWLYGGELTYVDLVLFQCLDGTKYAFPKTVEKLKKGGKYAGVFKLYDAVKERPNVKAYLESDRRVDYANGIWRHYPELEEDE
ncbi:glutathione S-transferase [Trichoderma gamsii]|uniref:Glutathione S-transferase n=1 Tax=Trichoderma gamsii TaxID=398673 RepID=A0A2P4ZHH6_9HYPO|nr:glutathione S-transferase [Trichoderma gamsii]PON23741.1 glutathione S-transferase [Trichoderma gamsii]